MTEDQRALLAAIVADPADDTARLVYADCIEEEGNSARAEFIRLQVTAERLHTDSNARAALEAQAEVLFAEHWIDWWAEVCAAMDFPSPIAAPKPTGILSRLSQWAWGEAPDNPFTRSGFSVRWVAKPGGIVEINGADFRRGFPETVYFNLAPPLSLRNWPTVSPLCQICCDSPYREGWDDGPHLGGLISLNFANFDSAVGFAVLESPHMTRLEEMGLFDPHADQEQQILVGELARMVAMPRMRQLKRMGLFLWSDEAAAIVANAANLAGLEVLDVDIQPPFIDDQVGVSQRLTMLAQSPHLTGLKELYVRGGPDPSGIEAVIQNPTWRGLRKLDLDVQGWYDNLDPLAGLDGLPDLEELRLSGLRFDTRTLAALTRSPLLKRIKHFAVRSEIDGMAEFDIAYAVNLECIETFAIGANNAQPRVMKMLQDRFGDRFRLLT